MTYKAHTTAWKDRPSAAERGYDYAWTKRRNRIMKRDKGLCQPCLKLGYVELAKEVDHILNKAQGGDEDDSNLQAICTNCHKEKTRDEAKIAQGSTPKRRVGLDGWPGGGV